ncbi:MAG: nucleoside-triphosphatase [Aristaeellaceae bacterium]
MARHIFLTGDRQIGKSTLLKKVLHAYHGKIGGFVTQKTTEFMGPDCSVHIFGLDEAQVFSPGNFLFICGKPNQHACERFDSLGCDALLRCADCSLIVMDELGRHEANAARFRSAVLEKLNGDTPILGVLQSPAEALWPEIVQHPKARILEITSGNRDWPGLADGILSDLQA